MPPVPPRLFAIIPAAGHSRRMGRPKLLLPVGGQTVIERLIATLTRPAVTAVVVVLRRDDEPLRAAVAAAGGLPVQPAIDPADMRRSVEIGLVEIQQRFQPQPEDGWLLIPADSPWLEAYVLDELLHCWRTAQPMILLPTCQGRRGHPAFFRWSLAGEVAQLPPDQGLNQLPRRHAEEVLLHPVEHPSVLFDLDTPEDYAALLRYLNERVSE